MDNWSSVTIYLYSYRYVTVICLGYDVTAFRSAIILHINLFYTARFAQMNVRPICIVLPINNLLVKCDKCAMECSVKGCRKFDRSTGHDKGIGVLEDVDVL